MQSALLLVCTPILANILAARKGFGEILRNVLCVFTEWMKKARAKGPTLRRQVKRKGRAAGKNSRRPADGGGHGVRPAPFLAAVAFPAIYIFSECLWKGGEAMWTIETLLQAASLLVALVELFLYLRKRK
ncbi:MAG: hypothetical protein FWF60_05030 [Oscillospiraceae bacterium]|nr:hypothetical protein [Oscillospiraceae bacterium]